MNRSKSSWTASEEIRFSESPATMDYLHGDVPDAEARSACMYEYARESRTLWAISKQRDEAKGRVEQFELRTATDRVVKSSWPLQPYFSHLLRIDGFPREPWSELTESERTQLFPRGSSANAGVRTPDLTTLCLFGIPNKLHAAAEALSNGRIDSEWEGVFTGNGSTDIVMLELDYSKGVTNLVRAFKAWLDAHVASSGRKSQSKTGRTGRFHDRLKDLAVWRIFREMDSDWEAANEFAAKRRKRFESSRQIVKMGERTSRYKPKDPRPFRDAKPKKGTKPNEADLCSELADFYKARTSAQKFLTALIPDATGQILSPELKAKLSATVQRLAGQ